MGVTWGYKAVAWLAAAALPLLAAPAAARAGAGDLDSGFGIAGTATLNFGGTDRATHVVIAPNGDVVVVGSTDATGGGDFAVARFKPDGSADSSFGSGGRVSLGTGAGINDIGGGAVVLPDERIVVAGQGNASKDFVVKQLMPDGNLDTSFGGGTGTAVVDFGGDDAPNAMVRQPDGRLVVVGSSSRAGGGFAIARLNADGTPDTSFISGAGKVQLMYPAGGVATGVAIAPDGKIIVSGGGRSDMVVTRLLPNGYSDASFGPDHSSLAYVDFGGNESANALALQPDGKIVLAGSTTATGSGDFAVARVNVDGTLDSSFNGTGKTALGYAAPDEAALGVTVQQNGRIVVMGNGDAHHDFVVSRLAPDGSTDHTFGAGGTVAVDFGGYEYDGDLAQQPDGKLVLAGSTNLRDGGDLAVARLGGDPPGGGTPPDPTLQLSVTPSRPIAGVRTSFTFTVRQYGHRRSRAYVTFDGVTRKASAAGIVRIADTLRLHSYAATATFRGAPNGSATVTPRYVPPLVLRVSPGKPIVGRITTFVFSVSLKGRPATAARVTFAGASHKVNRHTGVTTFTAALGHHPYAATASAPRALTVTLTLHPTFPFPFHAVRAASAPSQHHGPSS